MLSLIRQQSPYTVIILFIIALLMKLQPLWHPVAPVATEGQLMYGVVLRALNVVLGGNAFAYTLLTVVVLFGQAIQINAIAMRYRLFPRGGYAPAFFYIVLTSLYVPFNYFSVQLLVVWCLLAGVQIALGLQLSMQPRKQLFNAAFVFSIAAVLHFPAVIFIVALLSLMLLLRPFNAGEWTVALLGYFTPIYFFISILFLKDQLPLLRHWPDLDFSVQLRGANVRYLAGLVGGIVVLFACSLYALLQFVPKTVIAVRRSWIGIVICMCAAVPVAFCTEAYMKATWLGALPFLAQVLAASLMLEKYKWFSNFILYFSLALVVYCQLTYK